MRMSVNWLLFFFLFFLFFFAFFGFLSPPPTNLRELAASEKSHPLLVALELNLKEFYVR